VQRLLSQRRLSAAARLVQCGWCSAEEEFPVLVAQGSSARTGPRAQLAQAINPAQAPILRHAPQVMLQTRLTLACMRSDTVCHPGTYVITRERHKAFQICAFMAVYALCARQSLGSTANAGAARVSAGTAKSGTFNGKCTLCKGKGPRGGERYSAGRGATDCSEWCA
jgi:hypothetical protein